MKLVRFGPAGREKPGIIDSDGKIRDLALAAGGRMAHGGREPLGPRRCVEPRQQERFGRFGDFFQAAIEFFRRD
jgi:hypothetical protein